jgi:hypothetical protein
VSHFYANFKNATEKPPLPPKHVAHKLCPLETNFSDHTGVLVQVKNCFFNRKCKMETKRVRPVTLYGKFIFYHCLDNIDWDFLAYDFDVNHKFDMFLNNILSIFNTAFPEQI